MTWLSMGRRAFRLNAASARAGARAKSIPAFVKACEFASRISRGAHD